jgi:hypothetical protein
VASGGEGVFRLHQASSLTSQSMTPMSNKNRLDYLQRRVLMQIGLQTTREKKKTMLTISSIG